VDDTLFMDLLKSAELATKRSEKEGAYHLVCDQKDSHHLECLLSGLGLFMKDSLDVALQQLHH